MKYNASFNEHIITSINRLINFVLENPYSDFYRKKYKNLKINNIKSYNDFEKIPYLTKNEILAVPISERIALKDEQITHYSISSGTVNNKKIYISPRTNQVFSDTDGLISKKKLNSINAQKIMLLIPPFQMINLLIKILFSDIKIKIISGDINNLKLSAKIIKDLEVDCILLSPTILLFLIENLEMINFDFKKIKLITLKGEYCSSEKINFFRSKFPCALIYSHYAFVEASESVAYQCDYLSLKNKPNLFHPVEGALIEINNVESSHYCGNDDVGELIYTNLNTKSPFPLIRYKTGDMAKLLPSNCKCGNKYYLMLEGRYGSDIIKFHGVTLYSEIISNALNDSISYIEPRFQMHIYERKIHDTIKPELELHIKLKNEYAKYKNDKDFKENIAKKISYGLKLSSNKKLSDLVENNLFLPLKIIFIDSWPMNEIKNKNIISHIS